MTYSVNSNCWRCANHPQNGGVCKDAENLQLGVNKMYEDHETHRGGGIILLSCSNHKSM